MSYPSRLAFHIFTFRNTNLDAEQIGLLSCLLPQPTASSKLKPEPEENAQCSSIAIVEQEE